MKKVKGYIFLIMAVLTINIIVLSPKSAKSEKVVISCPGYHWLICTSGEWVIRCDCNGGPDCYAAWQELC